MLLRHASKTLSAAATRATTGGALHRWGSRQAVRSIGSTATPCASNEESDNDGGLKWRSHELTGRPGDATWLKRTGARAFLRGTG